MRKKVIDVRLFAVKTLIDETKAIDSICPEIVSHLCPCCVTPAVAPPIKQIFNSSQVFALQRPVELPQPPHETALFIGQYQLVAILVVVALHLKIYLEFTSQSGFLSQTSMENPLPPSILPKTNGLHEEEQALRRRHSLSKPPRHVSVPIDFFCDLNGTKDQVVQLVGRMQTLGFHITVPQFLAMHRCSINALLAVAS
ncbi:uncharacterized protein PHALS_02095 [Plasmopara halstedii]|uniref:Uncharacterized protein n=1 Tax=Plasmopara halstedii TaxID=4781 RepID=A0A0P1AYA5_PLAHL|nr:uncharacterized protein PHALS_02095 [Plasmopara halstedii]CEG45823.1 hypothetical protein PHALS_02095 [Plasmopara halstedii]|eukprot:XP_024582192.1 hypothetical protein PHALS_02095 [Plasmopara halstedii]